MYEIELTIRARYIFYKHCLCYSACVKFLAIPVDRDALHAVLKVCLRLTRDYRNAEVFAREGGVKLLLEMTQMCSFTGCINLCTLLIRHTLEEPRTLRLAMEKVLAFIFSIQFHVYSIDVTIHYSLVSRLFVRARRAIYLPLIKKCFS